MLVLSMSGKTIVTLSDRPVWGFQSVSVSVSVLGQELFSVSVSVSVPHLGFFSVSISVLSD